VTGTFKLIPSTLALMAVQRQSAASKSIKSLSKAQQSLVGGVPTTMFTSPKTLAQTPSFRVSLGHEAFGDGGGGGQPPEGAGFGEGLGVGGVGLGVGVGLGEGLGVGGVGFGEGGQSA